MHCYKIGGFQALPSRARTSSEVDRQTRNTLAPAETQSSPNDSAAHCKAAGWLVGGGSRHWGGVAPQASRKYNTTKLRTQFPSPSSHQHRTSSPSTTTFFPSPFPSPPPFSILQLQSKPVPGLERPVIEFLVSSCRVLLWALPVSNKFQSVNSPLTLAHPIPSHPIPQFLLRIPLRSCIPSSLGRSAQRRIASFYRSVFLIHLVYRPHRFPRQKT